MTVAPSVPRPRVLHHGVSGVDVVAVKRALSRAGYMRWGKFTAAFGDGMEDAVRRFQKDHDVRPASGLYGPLTHTALRKAHRKSHPEEWAFDSFAVYLMREEVAELQGTPEDRVRAAVVAAGYFWLAHRDAIAYAQSRPFKMLRPPVVPHEWDCSAFVTNCHYAGGSLNPNGLPDGKPRPWDGQGYTGTLMARGVRCTIAQLRPGDLVFYGHTRVASPAFPVGSPTHVAMFVGLEHGVPMVLSNGSHPMGHYPLRYRTDLNHVRHYTVV